MFGAAARITAAAPCLRAADTCPGRMRRSSVALLFVLTASVATANLNPCFHSNPLMRNPCRKAGSNFSKLTYCNVSASLEERVADAISHMSLPEKIGALGTVWPATYSLGLDCYNWYTEATSGVAWAHCGACKTTKFAFPITLAQSFNRSLWELTGRQIGREARALMNEGVEYSTFWAPVVNLAREPRWGRNLECPGEDPRLSGVYAASFVNGFQIAPEDPHHLQASACCKHFVANSMESTQEADGESENRGSVDENITMQDLVDSYMPSFDDCVQRGNVSGLMCSYNSVNGKPTCADDWLLTTVARDNWHFKGYITSDCDADEGVFSQHHYTATAEETVRDVLEAGVDVDCGTFVQANAASAFNQSLINQSLIDARIANLFRVRFRLGHFDAPGPLDSIPRTTIADDYAIKLSLHGTTQSSVLLKNANHTLPWNRSNVGTVAVIGPTIHNSASDAGYYGPHHTQFFPKFPGVEEAVQAFGQVKTVTAPGVRSASSEDQRFIGQAVNTAKSADAVVLAIGQDMTMAGEGHDAKNISLTEAQSSLVEQVAKAAKKPVVVLLLSATPLDISRILANPQVGAVLHLGVPSVTVLGVSDILYGDASPAGKTVQTFYESSYQDQISIFDFGMRPGPSKFARPDCSSHNLTSCPRGTNPGRSHRFYVGQPVVPFGFGLSYTSWGYNVTQYPMNLSLAPLQKLLTLTHAAGHLFPQQDDIMQLENASGWRTSSCFAIGVTNTGTRDADDVVLGFMEPPGAGTNGIPLQILFDFQRVHVHANATVAVHLCPRLTDFAQAQLDGQLSVAAGDYKVRFGLNETSDCGMGFAEVKTTAVATSDLTFMMTALSVQE